MTKEMDIYFRDLTPEAQKRVLEFFNMKDPSEGNYDVFPIAELVTEEE